MILTFIFNILHIILLFIPIAIYFIHEKYVKSWFKYYVLSALLTPLHWKFLNDVFVKFFFYFTFFLIKPSGYYCIFFVQLSLLPFI